MGFEEERRQANCLGGRMKHDVVIAQSIATITLRRPEAYNSLTAEMVRSLLQTAELLEVEDAVKAVIRPRAIPRDRQRIDPRWPSENPSPATRYARHPTSTQS